jgi:dCMP deaminase
MSEKWHHRFLSLAHEVASWSKDHVQVGAVVIDDNRNPRGFGYNGVPRNIDDAQPAIWDKPKKSWYFEHAERNVIYACARNGISCDNCTLVVTHWPCCDCTRAIIQSGIKHVVVDGQCLDTSGVFWQKWQEQIQESQLMLTQAGVEYTIVDTTINREKHD